MKQVDLQTPTKMYSLEEFEIMHTRTNRELVAMRFRYYEIIYIPRLAYSVLLDGCRILIIVGLLGVCSATLANALTRSGFSRSLRILETGHIGWYVLIFIVVLLVRRACIIGGQRLFVRRRLFGFAIARNVCCNQGRLDGCIILIIVGLLVVYKQ